MSQGGGYFGWSIFLTDMPRLLPHSNSPWMRRRLIEHCHVEKIYGTRINPSRLGGSERVSEQSTRTRFPKIWEPLHTTSRFLVFFLAFTSFSRNRSISAHFKTWSSGKANIETWTTCLPHGSLICPEIMETWQNCSNQEATKRSTVVGSCFTVRI